jgi:hypothetical protein
VLNDVVIDTNVLVHADNPGEERHRDAVELLDQLLEADTKLGIDEGFDIDPQKNLSLIGQEYLEKLTPTSLAYLILAHLAQTERVTFIPRSFGAHTRKAVNQILKNKRDRTFVLVAGETENRVLCSHDFKDFGKRKRKDIKTKLGVAIVDASAAVSLTKS